METCQAIPSILSCFWPAFHPKDTTKVNVLWLSSPPPNPPHFCNALESVELVLHRSQIGSKATEILLRLLSQSGLIRVVPDLSYCKWVCTSDKDEQKTDDQSEHLFQ